MKRGVWITVVVLGWLAGPSLPAIDIKVNVGGGGWSSCSANTGCPYPIFFPPYSYYGYAPWFYYAAPGAVSSFSTGPGGQGRTIRLGETQEEFWARHGGFDPDRESGWDASPLMETLKVDRESPLRAGDPERRIRDLSLGVTRIEASGQDAVYHLADGRRARCEGGVVVELLP